MEASTFAMTAAYALVMIFVFFGVANGAEAPTPTPEAGAGSMLVASSVFTSVIAFFIWILL